MRVRTFFHLDCSPVIPECGYQCDKCVREILAVLGRTDGVLEVSPGMHGEISGIVVQHDPETTGDHKLANVLGGLPSFCQGKFIPQVLND